MPDANVNDTTSEPDGNVKSRVYLRNDQFNLRANIIDATTEEARAALIGVDYRTLNRARRGKEVSGKFIAGTLAAFQRHTSLFRQMNLDLNFEALFDVVHTTEGQPQPSTDEVVAA